MKQTTINKLICKRGLTQAAVALRIGIHPAQMSRYCRFVVIPPIERQDAIAIVLGISRNKLWPTKLLKEFAMAKDAVVTASVK